MATMSPSFASRRSRNSPDGVVRRALDINAAQQVFRPALVAELKERPYEFDIQVQTPPGSNLDYMRIKLEELIDESFRAMGEDADYRKEAVLILEQFAESNAGRLALED